MGMLKSHLAKDPRCRLNRFRKTTVSKSRSFEHNNGMKKLMHNLGLMQKKYNKLNLMRISSLCFLTQVPNLAMLKLSSPLKQIASMLCPLRAAITNLSRFLYSIFRRDKSLFTSVSTLLSIVFVSYFFSFQVVCSLMLLARNAFLSLRFSGNCAPALSPSNPPTRALLDMSSDWYLVPPFQTRIWGKLHYAYIRYGASSSHVLMI